MIAAAVLLMSVSQGVVSAASGDTIPGGVIAGVSFGEPPVPGAGTSPCTWRRANPHDAHLGRGGEVSKVVDGRRSWLYERRCPEADDLVWVPEVSGEELGRQAADQVRRLLPALQIMTAPPADRAVVHVPVWFWVADWSWRAVEATAWVPFDDGVLWATARAVPSQVRFDPGDGVLGQGPVTCPGPGRPWAPADGDHAQSACSVTFRHTSRRAGHTTFPAVAQVVWTTSWSSNTGEGGPLTPLISSVGVPIEVHEIHALVSR